MPKPVGGSNAQVNLTDKEFVAMIIEINMVGRSNGWRINICASSHVYYDCAMFKTYANAENKKVSLGVVYTTKVVDFGEMEQRPLLKRL